MNTKQDRAFLDAIIEDPEDDTPRLVYADWLDDQGEAERAELIRLQYDDPCSRIGDEGLQALAETEHLPGLRPLLLVNQMISHSGLEELAACRLLGQLTWLKLNGTPIGDNGVKALSASKHSGRLRVLGLYNCLVTKSGARDLAKSSRFKSLEYLDLTGN